MKDDVLDDFNYKEKNEEFLNIIKWWEKKRIIYNLIIISFQVILMVSQYKAILNYGFEWAIAESIAFTIVANLLYLLGPAIEVYGLYYFNSKIFKKSRWGIFFIGSIFSLLVTFSMYMQTLKYYSYYQY